MKKIILKTMLLAMVVLLPVSAAAEVRVHINIPLPPPIFFPVLPQLVVIPDTDVYAVPDISDDVFFYAGWWWRPWNNRWYRSRYHDRDWAYYPHAPYFHRMIPSDWRTYYRNHTWKGYRWEPPRVYHRDVQNNWRAWQKDRHWERQSYGIQKRDSNRTAPQYNSRTRSSVPKATVQGRDSRGSRQPVRSDRRPSGGNNRH